MSFVYTSVYMSMFKVSKLSGQSFKILVFLIVMCKCNCYGIRCIIDCIALWMFYMHLGCLEHIVWGLVRA